MRRAILLGPLPPRGARGKRLAAAWLREARLGGEPVVIAVDGGLAAWRGFPVKADFAIGDWDGLIARLGERGARRELSKVRHFTLPVAKDASDLAFALDLARWTGVRELVALGFTGGREDHQLGMLFELAAASARFRRVTSRGPAADYEFVDSRGARRWSAKLARGTTVSVFALGAGASRVVLKGFRYPLPGGRLAPGSRGLSNVARGGTCSVAVGQGQLLVVIPREVG
jgi:thiamine pyrophosphokinase